MFAAGTYTTYITLEWEVAELLKHPKTMEKLQNEVRQVAGSKLEIIEDDLEKNVLYEGSDQRDPKTTSSTSITAPTRINPRHLSYDQCLGNCKRPNDVGKS